MSKQKTKISIVTPMYNEQECLREYYKRSKIAYELIDVDWEIIIIDDGSTDSTPEILREICNEDPRVVGVFLSMNRGQSAAIQAGIDHSTGDYVAILDGDLQNPPEEVSNLLASLQKGYDMAKGIRENRSESRALRLIPSKIANWLIRKTSKCDVRDMGGPSMMKREVARKLVIRNGEHRFLPALVSIMGGKISSVHFSCPQRFAGKSHYGFGRFIDVIFDIFMLYFRNATKQRPLYLFGRLSLIFGTIAAGFFIYPFFDRIINDVAMTQRPFFYISLFLFISSLWLLSTGIILEVLTGIQRSVGNEKSYVVKDLLNRKLG